MACHNPIQGYKSRTVSPNGKRAVVFNIKDGYRDLPVTIPCGNCIGCRIDRVRQWTTRLRDESLFWEQKCFLTLTYDAEHLPEGGTLVKRDLQLFMKRLRKAHGGKLKFFACGEYGEQLSRPHYHMVLFGCDFSDRKQHSLKGGHTLWTSETLTRLWGMGFCTIGTVTEHSCQYVASYVIKKVTGEAAATHYRRLDPFTGEVFDLQPEFITMSKRPGIGADFFESFESDLFPSDFTVTNGRPLSVPKYYDRQLEKRDPGALAAIKVRRIRKAARRKADNTPDRLRAKAEVAKAKLSLKSRTF